MLVTLTCNLYTGCMATTSKSTARKKTKTTRKVSAASTRKTTVKKAAPKKRATARAASTKKAALKAAPALKNSRTAKADTSSSAAAATTSSSAKSVINDAMESLRSLNFFVVFASAVQAGLILWLSRAFGGIRGVTASYPTSDALATASTGQTQTVTAVHRLFDMHLSWMIAAYFIVTAIMHLAISTWMRARYEREIGNNVNRMRWATFAVSGSLVLMTIALAGNITDFVTLLAIAGFTVLGSLVALSREHYTQNRERSRLIYGIGAIAVAAPWVIFLLNVFGTYQYGEGGTPKFMYGVYATGLVLVLALAKNLREQTRGRGRWIDYIFAEKAYTWLCLIGNSAVAWQIYAALLKK